MFGSGQNYDDINDNMNQLFLVFTLTKTYINSGRGKFKKNEKVI